MKLQHEFYKLPFAFDVKKLTQEVLSLSEDAWLAHPDGFDGNASVPLISRHGEQNNDFHGAMKATPVLLSLEYIQQVLAAFGEVFGRSRLMRLSPGSEVPLHTDTNYHWYKRVRIHIPIITDTEVIFHCDDKQVNMAAGETWIFDSWKHHKVVNQGKTNRVHLVIDTSGSSKFWQMVDRSAIPCENIPAQTPTQQIAYQINKQVKVLTEQYNSPLVMCAGEIDGVVADIINEMKTVPANKSNEINKVVQILNNFKQDWRQLWSLFGISTNGWPHYQQLRTGVMAKSQQFDPNLVATNGVPIADVIQYCLLMPALNVALA